MSAGGRLQTALTVLLKWWLDHGEAGGKPVGVQTVETWAGPERLTVASKDRTHTYRVCACASTLALRAALAAPRTEGETPVLLWAHPAKDLPEDIRARLRRGRLERLEPWDLALAALDVTSVDPLLDAPGSTPWLPERLLDAIDQSPAPLRPRNGYLDAETGWAMLIGPMLGLPPQTRQDLPGMLATFEDAGARAAWVALKDDERAGLRRRVEALSGPAAGPALGSWMLAEEAPTPLSAGLVLDALGSGHARSDRDDVRRLVRFEDRLGLAEDDRGARGPWASAAVAAVERLEEEPRRRALARADALAAEHGLTEACHGSVWLPSAWKARVGAFAEALAVAVEGPAAGPSQQLLALEEDLGRHRLSHDTPALRTRDRVRASLSLLRWLGLPTEAGEAPSRFEDAARSFADGGSHADDARRRVLGGDAHPRLDAAVRGLLAAAGKKREAENERFGASLAAHLEKAPAERAVARNHGLVPADCFVDEVLVPLAKTKRPLLLIVADGLPLDLARPLVRDADLKHWREQAFEGDPRRLLGVAPLPTVTRLARTTLLTGRRAVGDAETERAGFAGHDALHAAGGKGALRPLLLHKSKYFRSDRSGLTETCRAALEDTKQRVVGVVINAVDDALGGNDRVEEAWSAGDLPGLRDLFRLAEESQRLVVLTSDHGHVSERGTAALVADRVAEGGGGERWRPGRDAAGDPVEPGSGERLFRGPGVGFPGEEGVGIVAPWTESLRYTRGANDGYHGGATPQEVITPILVLDASPEKTVGLEDLPEDTPLWVIDPGLDAAHLQEAEAAPPPARPRPTPEPAPAGGLFEPEAEPAPPAEPRKPTASHPWISDLLASEVFASQKSTVGRRPLDDDSVAAWLVALADLGNQVTLPAIASRLSLSPVRTRGEVAILQRLLNVDGYEVLTLEGVSQTLRLNRELLLIQFDLPDAC